jgi:predicted MFS family arabinose efflux permease
MHPPQTPPAPASTIEIVAICAAATLAVTTLNIAPGLEPQLRAELGLSPRQVGLFFAVELGAMAAASPAFCPLLRRLKARPLARSALGLWLAAQWASMAAPAPLGMLLAARALAGLAAGCLMLLALEAAGRCARPQRLLAIVVAFQITGGALALAMLPVLFAAGGLAAVFGASGLLAIVAWGIVSPLCSRLTIAPGPLTHAPHVPRTAAIRVFLVALLFNGAVGALWTFVPELAPASLEPARLAPLLAQATLFGLCGAAAAGVLGVRESPRAWRMTGVLLLGAAAIALSASEAVTAFALGCFVASFAWNFSVPFVLSLGAPEAGVSVMPAVNAAFAIGLAAGPAIGGALLESSGAAGLAAGVATLLVMAAALDASSRPR